MASDRDIEILPPDPNWHAPRDPAPVVYDTGPEELPPQDGVRQAEKAGNPAVMAQLWRFGSRLGVVVLGLGLAVWLFEPFGPHPLDLLVSFLRTAGALGRAIVVLGIALAVPFLVPVGPAALIPSYLWGATEGTVWSIVAATLGGSLNVLIAKRFLHRHVLAWAERNAMVAALLRTIGARGFRIVLVMRLSPVMSYSVLSYLSGLTTISLPRFALAATLGGIPWTLAWALFGAILAQSGQSLSLSSQPTSPYLSLLRWIGLGVSVFLALWISRVARQDVMRARQERL